MTLLLGFEAVDQGKTTWDDMVPISESAWKMGGSKMFLEVGKQIKYRDLVTGISVVSANDGCVALAEYLYGSESAFVAVMNERAKKLGLTKTHFENATGLPAEGHVMSARDISTLADYLIEKHPDILKIESQREFTYNNIRQFNRNPLLGAFQGADGLKTGWTDAAGYCLVGTAKQEDMRLIAVVLNTRNEQERLTASQELLNYGFKNFVKTTVKNSGDIVGSIDIKKGKKLTVPVKVQDNITVVIPSARKNDIKIEAVKDKDSLNAPAAAGTAVGKLEVKLDGRVLASSAIATAEDVSKAGFFELLFRAIGNFFKSLF
jgi:D-alanyl-D-alanine carboxypeptidase (penicillin-binding protein 5/6)